MSTFAAFLLAFLFAPAASPTSPPPPPRRAVLDSTGGRPRAAEPPKLVPTQAPIFVDVERDAGGVEKREAGVMKLVSTPPTEVTLNGRRLGVTPLYLTAAVGQVELILESRDAGIYKPVAVTLFAGQNPPQSWELAHGWLEVVAPEGSLVSIDGRAVGIAPVEQLSLYEGFHRIDVVRANKTRATARVEVVAHFTITHEIGD